MHKELNTQCRYFLEIQMFIFWNEYVCWYLPSKQYTFYMEKKTRRMAEMVLNEVHQRIFCELIGFLHATYIKTEDRMTCI